MHAISHVGLHDLLYHYNMNIYLCLNFVNILFIALLRIMQ